MHGHRKITFFPKKRTVSVPTGHTILDAARQAGMDIDSVCGGKGKCKKCTVKILAQSEEDLNDITQHVLAGAEPKKNLRLACQTLVEDGMEVLILNEAAKIGPRGKETDISVISDFKARIKKRYLKINLRSNEDLISDLEVIGRAVPGLKQPNLKILKKIARYMRKPDFKATIALKGDEVLCIEDGNTEKKNYGLAVDLGTTTVAVYLVDLHSAQVVDSEAALNEQSPFGSDVISRISYAIEHPRKLAILQKAAAGTVNNILHNLLTKNSIDRKNIYLITVAGNPTMVHLFLGINPQGLAEFPFNPAIRGLFALSASETGLSLPAHAKLEVLPSVSAYVGADAVAAALAAGLDRSGPPRLLLDLGTNGEVVLAHNGNIWACSTAAGPALEGGAIKFGMRAVRGAICAIHITDDVEISIIDDKTAKGLCGSGLLDAVAQMIGCGLIGKTGRLKNSDSLPVELSAAIRRRLLPGEKGQNFHLTQEVYITQEDINQLQLAKGALRAGIEILMTEAGITSDKIEEIMLAGAFGAGVRPESLIAVGLLPPFPPDKIRAIGNAAGVGALLCLLSDENNQRALNLSKHIKYVELSLRKDFQDRFLQGMKF